MYLCFRVGNVKEVLLWCKGEHCCCPRCAFSWGLSRNSMWQAVLPIPRSSKGVVAQLSSRSHVAQGLSSEQVFLAPGHTNGILHTVVSQADMGSFLEFSDFDFSSTNIENIYLGDLRTTFVFSHNLIGGCVEPFKVGLKTRFFGKFTFLLYKTGKLG